MGSNLSLTPRLPEPWIYTTGQQAGQPTPAFYRFILNLLSLAGGSASFSLEQLILLVTATPQASPQIVEQLKLDLATLSALVAAGRPSAEAPNPVLALLYAMPNLAPAIQEVSRRLDQLTAFMAAPPPPSATFAASLSPVAINTVFGGPESGGSANPAFRSLVAADIPALSYISYATAQTLTTPQQAQAQSNMGLGSMATQAANDVDITGGTIEGTEIITAPTLVSRLGTPTAGARSMVSDASVTTFASIVVGLGTNTVPVYADGSNWRIG
jgi:hypothetical protein